MNWTERSFKVLAGTIVAAALLVAASACSKKDAELVYRAYEFASVYPEAFDNYAIENLFARADEFESCATRVRARLAQTFVRVAEGCKSLELEYQAACNDVDETRVVSMLEAMVATARQQTLYAQSTPGQAAVMGKQLLGAGQWEKTQRQLAAVVKPVLVCR